jgi:hypothetical protein
MGGKQYSEFKEIMLIYFGTIGTNQNYINEISGAD